MDLLKAPPLESEGMGKNFVDANPFVQLLDACLSDCIGNATMGSSNRRDILALARGMANHSLLIIISEVSLVLMLKSCNFLVVNC